MAAGECLPTFPWGWVSCCPSYHGSLSYLNELVFSCLLYAASDASFFLFSIFLCMWRRHGHSDALHTAKRYNFFSLNHCLYYHQKKSLSCVQVKVNLPARNGNDNYYTWVRHLSKGVYRWSGIWIPEGDGALFACTQSYSKWSLAHSEIMVWGFKWQWS